MERWSDAILLGESRLATTPLNSAGRWNLGWAYFKVNDYANAVTHLRAATELSSASPSCHWALAYALLEAGEVRAAESEFRTALNLRDHYLAWQGLALLYLRSGDIESAEQTHRDAMQRRPDSRERSEAYADFLTDVGRADEAKAEYARAATLWPESPREVH